MAGLEQDLAAGYPFEEGAWVRVGRPLTPDLETPVSGVDVGFPLAMLNRHGLVAGATGTGKTKTLQLLAEQLSAAGVPVLLADLKGDLSGLAEPAAPQDFIDERMAGLGLPWEPTAFPVELLSLTGEVGVQVRVRLADFGPLLLAKVIGASDVQESVLQVVFQYAVDSGRALDTLEDLADLLGFLASDAGEQVQQEYGGITTTTLNVLRRELITLRGQGGGELFGAPGFDVADLRRRADDGRGMVSIVSLVDMQTRPLLFSTFLLWLLTAVYADAPEVGDPDRPELVFFFDEAHLLFDGASRALVDLVELTVRMIRSKGIGVVFVTQQPTDLPDDVLAQLGTRVQHALRAFTPDDQKALRATAATFPTSEHYDVQQALTGVGIGEAVVTGLDPDGAPMPTVATRFVAPESNMDPASAETIAAVEAASSLREKYAAVSGSGAVPTAGAGTAGGAADAPAGGDDASGTDGGATGAGPAAVAAAGAAGASGASGAGAVGSAPGATVHTCAARRVELVAATPPRSLQVEEVDPASGRAMKTNLRDGLAPAEVGELAVQAGGLRFVSAATELGVGRDELRTLRVARGLLVLGTAGGTTALQLVDEDLVAVLAAWFPDGTSVDPTRLPALPDDVAEALGTAPAASGGAAGPGQGDPVDGESGPGRVGRMATSRPVEDVAAIVGKRLGVNKGTTRGVFRALRRWTKR